MSSPTTRRCWSSPRFAAPDTFLAVTCDETVTNERERRRGDRAIGLARYQSGLVHAGLRPHDLTLDTNGADADALANRAQSFVVSSAPAGLRSVVGA